MSRFDILIVGHGYVGSAISNAFKKDTVTIIDPKYNNNRLIDFKGKRFDIIFVSVDTPKRENFKTLDTVLSGINLHLPGNIVCSKSTATPEFYFNATKKYKNISIIHSPEYLSHRNNKKDFEHQTFLILGGNKKESARVSKIFTSRLKYIKEVRVTDIKTAALIKYSENAFLALKVTFANELYKIHKQQCCNSSFEEFTEMLGLDPRITQAHMQVPGWDGKLGWGGHCLIKDNYELEKFSGSPLVKFIRNLNKRHREG